MPVIRGTSITKGECPLQVARSGEEESDLRSGLRPRARAAEGGTGE